jgi:hypothetical protein
MSYSKAFPGGYEGWGFKIDDTVRAVRDAVAALAELRRNGVPALSSSHAALRLAAEALRSVTVDVEALGVEFASLLIRIENVLEAAAGGQ